MTAAQLTRSPLLVAAVALLETIPHLVLQLPIGALLDRWDRRRTMLQADVARCMLTLLVPVTAYAHGPLLLVLFGVAVPLSVADCLFGAGFGAITPSLAGREHAAAAYALVEGGESLAWVAGPVLAGLLVIAIGGANALAVDAQSFLVSAAGLGLIRGPARAATGCVRPSMLRELGRGSASCLGTRCCAADSCSGRSTPRLAAVAS